MHGREEIQRIKAANPEIPHREAFSAAAKNVTLFHFFNIYHLACLIKFHDTDYKIKLIPNLLN